MHNQLATKTALPALVCFSSGAFEYKLDIPLEQQKLLKKSPHLRIPASTLPPSHFDPFQARTNKVMRFLPSMSVGTPRQQLPFRLLTSVPKSGSSSISLRSFSGDSTSTSMADYIDGHAAARRSSNRSLHMDERLQTKLLPSLYFK